MFRSDPQNRSYVVKSGAGICYRRNRKHLPGVPNVLPPVPNNEPDDTDIQAEDPGEILPPDGPGDEVELPVDVPVVFQCVTPSFAGLRATGLTTNHAGTEESTCCILLEIKSFLLLSDVTNVTLLIVQRLLIKVSLAYKLK